MNIKILYDNDALPGFRSGWGFSALVNDTLLFDTGEAADSLRANMQAFGIDPGGIDTVVLSHEDWDHVGGIDIIADLGEVTVHIPASFSNSTRDHLLNVNPDASVRDVREEQSLGPTATITRELGNGKREISLAVRCMNGIVLVSGCAHPGLERIMAAAGGSNSIHAVVGGFHDFHRLEALQAAKIIVPTHCTQKKDEIESMYPDKTRRVKAGSQLDF